jgi:nucleoside-diphosphate-sugar epimerase
VYRLDVEWTNSRHWLGQRVLVTGASGFLGRALCRLLAEAGADVHGTWRSRPPPANIHAHHALLPADAEDLIQKLAPARVFHLASPIDHSADVEAFSRLREGILDASIAVATACATTDARLTHVGTCAEYGDQNSPLSEDMPCRPRAAYGALKLAATEAILAMTRTGPLNAVVLRPFRAHGPHDLHSLVAQACQAATLGQELEITDGSQIREWNGVYEIAEGIMAAGCHPELSGQILNIGGGPRASVREVASLIFEQAGASPSLLKIGARPPRPGDVAELWSDSSRARELLSLPTPAPLELSLGDTLEWHQGLREAEARG